jgi:GntR family transcriptional regulator
VHPTLDERLPLYQRLRDRFSANIRSGLWSADRPLPSEQQLAQENGVALGTARKAIEALVAEGLLQRKQGSGTYVRRADFGSALFRFFRHTGASGEVLHPRGEMLSVRTLAAPAAIAAHLGLGASAPVLRLHRRRWVNDEPIVFEEIFVDAGRFRALAALPLPEFGDLLYPLYEKLCGVRIFRAAETIRFDRASARVAKHLDCPAGEAVAVIERTACGIDGAALEWRRSFGQASRFSYSIELR